MPERADLMQAIYGHALQLTLIDYPVAEAMRIAWRLAAVAWDEAAYEAGMAEARESVSRDEPDPTS